MYAPPFRIYAINLYNIVKNYRYTCKLLSISIYNISSINKQISTSTLHNWIHNGITPKKRITQFKKLTNNVKHIIINEINANPLTTLNDIKNIIHNEDKKNISVQTISKYIKVLRFSKKKIYHGVTKKYNYEYEIIFKNKINDLTKNTNITFIAIDESYFSEKVLANIGYSETGKRLILGDAPTKWTQKSLLCAIYSNGTYKYEICNGSVNKEKFNTFINNLNVKENEYIILDNVAFHKSSNQQFIFTPPYMPKYNPIENFFSICKHYYLKYKRTSIDVNTCIHKAICYITKDNILQFFNHLFHICLEKIEDTILS